MSKIVIDQDKERIVIVENCELFRFSFVYYNGILMGVNLFYGDYLLATYEDMKRCTKEVENIKNTDKVPYFCAIC